MWRCISAFAVDENRDTDGKFIHASGRVKVNSIDPQAEDFVGYPCLSISRIVGRIGTPGIARVAGHPWYFNR